MLIKDIFTSQLNLSSEILTTTQEDNAFIRCCDLFFGSVKTTHKIEKDLFISLDLKINSKILNDELLLGIGTFKIVRIVDGVDFVYIKVAPLDYANFKIDIDYREDFRMVCDYLIKEISISNLDILKGIGVDQTELPNQQYQEIKEALVRKYNTETGVTVIGKLVE
ncbi:hypothetical protein MNB_SUP05-5-911 [hydrothermal vent metagenome]|uniref:Uncharacterized protein n=1 Tax=hydrothermal vent metagenome TaxID=652676 RepID=A0A1W1BRI3_9ZZZZ